MSTPGVVVLRRRQYFITAFQRNLSCLLASGSSRHFCTALRTIRPLLHNQQRAVEEPDSGGADRQSGGDQWAMVECRLSADGSSHISKWAEACRGHCRRGLAAVSPGRKILEPSESSFFQTSEDRNMFRSFLGSELQVVAAPPLFVGPGNLFLLFALVQPRAQEVLVASVRRRSLHRYRFK